MKHDWKDVGNVSTLLIDFFQIHCYPDPVLPNEWRYKIGSTISNTTYGNKDRAKAAALRKLERIAVWITENVKEIPGYTERVPTKKVELDDWHVSILGLGRKNDGG
jgi:hypothetical protein